MEENRGRTRPAPQRSLEDAGGHAAVLPSGVRRPTPAPDAAAGGRLRVLYAIDSLEVGGSELNAVRTAERLDRSRFDVTTLTFRAGGPLEARLQAAGLAVRAFPLAGGGVKALPGLVWRLSRLLRRERVDIVHSHDSYSNVYLSIAARLAGTPVVITSKRWARWHPPELGPRNALAFRLSHRVLANSETVAESLIREDRVTRERITVLHNFLDEDAFAPLGEAERQARLASFGIPAGARVVGVVAGLKPVKQHEILLRAVASLRDRHPAVRVLLVGDGARREPLAATARELGIEDIVHFAGYQPNIPNPHRWLDVSALTSSHEGFPNSVVEAMAAARPVVATRVGGVPDAVEDGVTGLLVPPGAPDDLARALDTLLADPARGEAFGAAGQRRARERYHASAIIPAVEAFYERLVRERGRR